MNAERLEVGDKLMAITGFSWLIEGETYTITEILESAIVLDKGLHWQKSGVSDNFVVVITK
jgi:hypothetical protein